MSENNTLVLAKSKTRINSTVEHPPGLGREDLQTKDVEYLANDDDDELNTFAREMMRRREAIATRCREKANATESSWVPKRVLDKLIFHKSRGLLWCPVFKAASTTWLNNFIEIQDNKSKVMNRYKN